MENDLEHYRAKSQELETEVLYLSEILKQIIGSCTYGEEQIEALARAGYNAYLRKRA